MAASDKSIATIEIRGKRLAGHTRGAVIDSGKPASFTGKGVVSTRVKNYAGDPFFLKKAAEAKAEIDRVGLPKTKK
jgi:hypothetical protein